MELLLTHSNADAINRVLQQAHKSLQAYAESPEPATSFQENATFDPDEYKTILQSITSPLPLPTLASSITEAIHSSLTPTAGAVTPATEVTLQTALFSLLGDDNMGPLFTLFENAPKIYNLAQALSPTLLAELAAAPPDSQATASPQSSAATDDAASALYAAQLAAAELSSLPPRAPTATTPAAPALVGVTVKHSSDKLLQKQQKQLKKQHAKLKNQMGPLSESADYLESLGFDPSYLAQERSLGLQGGGFRGADAGTIRGMLDDLKPEGTKQYYEDRDGLPANSERSYHEGFEQVYVPPAYRDEESLPPRVVCKEHMDPLTLKGFHPSTKTLNPMQSTVFPAAFNSQENLLICAPTGAGKTNVALLALLAHFRDRDLLHPDRLNAASTGSFDSGNKVIYIAPMKALAQEVVEKFSARLKSLHLTVNELTGDMQLTKQQAERTDVIVTTPEKWDVVTRKGGDGSLAQSCGLLIIDEVHLLADGRGAVIESIVARLHRLVESSQKQSRIVGLSATLPNYKDVATFLQVNHSRGLFYFGPEYRPVPLAQTFIGHTLPEKDRYKCLNKMNEITYDIILDSLKNNYQCMIFVHSRKETGLTLTALAEIAQKRAELAYFQTQTDDNSAFTKYLPSAQKSRNAELRNHFQNGMGIHHAGMLRGDRKLSETMFAEGAIKVLCCTATLAWGVNLPAHTVVIKGTQVYNSEKGGMTNLSILDVQQIFGRAGRPQFDTFGEAHLITSQASLPRYLNLLVNQSAIESNFIKQLADHLNAEVVGGTVCNITEAARWLQYTYLYVRMLKNPMAYGIKPDTLDSDPQLHAKTTDLVKDAAKLLDSRRMLRFDPRSGNLAVTDMGRVASHFYIQNESIATFNELLARMPNASEAQLIHVICSACEFVNVKVRQEELKEIDEMKIKYCPLAVHATVDESAGKSNVLLQAFICHARPKSFTLTSDINYIASNAGRVARALFEMCLRAGKAAQALKLLRIAKSIDKRVWWFHTPLRQFSDDLPSNIFPALESRGYVTFDYTQSMLEMIPEEVGQLAHWARGGHTIQKHVRFLPSIELEVTVQPVTRGILKFSLELTSRFDWHAKHCGGAQGFWLWVEDGENERIYHQEYVLLSKRNHPEIMELELTIPAFEPLPPQYYVRIVSDSFVGCEQVIPVSFQHLLLPARHLPYTDLADLTPLPTTALHNPLFESLYESKFETFNPIQTQLFHLLYYTNKSLLLGAPTGSGKTIVAELAILRMKNLDPSKKAVYIAPLKSLARERLKEWKKNLGQKLGWTVLELSGDTSHDVKTMARADVLVCTPEKWDLITRNWRDSSRTFVKDVALLIIDEIHLLGEDRGAVLEAIVSRTRYISSFAGTETRIVGLSTALANPRDLAEWMGIDFDPPNRGLGMYNFRPSVRPIPMTVHIQGFPGRAYCPRMATMNKPCYAAIREHSPEKPIIIFVASRRQTRLTAMDLISYAAGDDNPRMFLHGDIHVDSINDAALKHTLSFGIGLHHAGLCASDRDTVEKLFLSNEIQVLVATSTLAWGVNLPAHLVIVKGTEFFDGKTMRYVDYPVTDVLQMMGRAGRPQFDTEGIACVLVQEGKKNFYKKFLYEPFPVESKLEARLPETLNAEIAVGTVKDENEAAGYMNWTYLSRRVVQNPSYYKCEGNDVEQVQAWFGALVAKTVDALEKNGCVECAMSKGINPVKVVTPTALGKAASKFYLQHTTPMEMLEGLKVLRADLLAGGEEVEGGVVARILEILAFCTEFDEVPVRHNEELLNAELAEFIQFPPSEDMDYEDPHCKCFLLLQAYIEKTKLPISDYIGDTKSVIDQVGRLLAAMLYIAVEVGTTIEVAESIVMAKQSMTTRMYGGREFLFQVLGGIVEGGEGRFSKRASMCRKAMERLAESTGLGSLYDLKRAHLEMGDAKFIKKIRGAGLFKEGLVCDGLKRVPFVTIMRAFVGGVGKGMEVEVLVEDAGGGGRGERGGRGESLTVMVGDKSSRRLLGLKSFGVERGGKGGCKKTVVVPLTDLGVGGYVVKVMHEGQVGMDVEIEVE